MREPGEKAKRKAGCRVCTSENIGSEIVNAASQPKADAGIYIGYMLMGMHLKKAAVPVRPDHEKIGEANVRAARTRPRFIGGIRAEYHQELL